MKAILGYEWKAGQRIMLIWAIAVGAMGLVCILMFKSMEDSMAQMAAGFAAMGAFAKAFGMNTLSMATVKGFFATEVGSIHELGSSMFAAALATGILSKEEDGHTAEFTYTLPLSRGRIVTMKFLAVVFAVVVFTLICAGFYSAGFVALKEQEFAVELFLYLLLQFLMNLEMMAICFVISAVSKKNRLGLGMAVVMLFYAYEIMARIIPSLEKVKFLSPFSYGNATTIFAGMRPEMSSVVFGIMVTILMTAAAGFIYIRRDLAS